MPMGRAARYGVTGIVAAVVLGGAMSPACAEDRPINQLPQDVVRWSTVWVEVPKAMVMAGEEYGPLGLLTVGPAQGAAAMVESTGRELYDAMKPQTNPAQRYKNEEGGAVFRYQF